MKKSILILFLFAAVVSMSAQSAEEIVKQATKARGDVTMMKKKPSSTEMTITSNAPAATQENGAQAQKMVMNIKLVTVSQKRIRVDLTSPMGTAIVVMDGKSGWMSQNGTVQDIPEEQLEMMINQYSGNGMGGDFELFDYKNKGKEVSILGSEMLENGDCWIIGLAEKGKQPVKFWINKESLLTEKMTARSSMLGQEMEMEINLGGYQKMEGILMPTVMAVNVMGSVADIKITDFHFLSTIDESLFAKPTK